MHQELTPSVQRVLAAVEAYPGITRTGLCLMTSRSWGTIGHHVEALIVAGAVRQVRRGREQALYAAKIPIGRTEWVEALADPLARDMVERLAMGPHTLHSLALVLGRPRRILRLRLQRLEARGIVLVSRRQELELRLGQAIQGWVDSFGFVPS